jgi:UDP-N-acetylglucosamine transferase subunit ALG13
LRLFVTVGNATVGFDRLLRIVDEALETIGMPFGGTCQVGVSTTAPRGLRIEPFLSRQAFEREMAHSDVVICHAGVGTIRAARSFGHRPFVLPRLGALGEHVNDHQLELFEALTADGFIRPVLDAPTLAKEMPSTRRGGPASGPRSDDLSAVLGALSSGVGTPRAFSTALLRVLGLGRSAQGLALRWTRDRS